MRLSFSKSKLTPNDIDAKAMLPFYGVANCKSVTLVPSQWTILTVIVFSHIPNVQSDKELLQFPSTCRSRKKYL